jgi:hypothetical protein
MPNPLEDPTPIIVAGVLAEIVLGILLWKSGRGFLLWFMAGVAAMTALGVLISWLVVTPRERITMMLDEARRAVVANNLDATLEFIAPAAKDERQWVQETMRRFEFREATIRGLEIDLEQAGDVQQAEAWLIGIADFRDRRGEFSSENYPARLKIKLQRFGQRWLITQVLDAGPYKP